MPPSPLPSGSPSVDALAVCNVSGISCEALIVLGTWALVVAAFLAIGFQVEFTRRALNADTFARMNERWDSSPMRSRRKRLAGELQANKLVKVPPGSIDEVFGFFEDLGVMVRKGWLPLDAVWQSFTSAARHYWAACHQYVTDTRNHLQDKTYYSEFEFLVDKLDQEEVRRQGKTTKEEVAITSKMADDFLQKESALET